eukprot:TRINITY_DN1482_c0_g1_i1.p1 TRINITY_DN1482_c0_g1~~TRINITY_DN1482_c0_g1_i1.p1  ORF type:complete len:257 (+),score=79.75 TRINITY_DN1482_c0_g1_i1:211-981(+)
MEDLALILQSLGETFARKKERVFVVVEGLYANYGDLAPLPQILELKKKFPFRIILEESFSIGVIGDTGRGITEYYGLSPKSAEVICGSVGNAIGGVGGFALGDKPCCEHMRLNCTGYVFSCSLPPYISAASVESVNLLAKGKEVAQLASNTKYLHRLLKGIDRLTCSASENSPLVHLRLKTSLGSRKADETIILQIIDQVFEKYKIVLTSPKYVPQEKYLCPPSIKIAISAQHTEEEIATLVKAIKEVSSNLIKSS